jgi:hypothetical protein
LDREITPLIQAAFAIGGQEGRKAIRKQEGPSLAATFTINNPAALERASLMAALAVTRADDAAKRAIREIIVQAFERHGSIFQQKQQLVTLLRETIGLDLPRARSLLNLQASLVERGISAERVRVILAGQRKRLLAARALTIARQETSMAVHAGQDEMWRQMQSQGILPKTAQRQWVVAFDDRLCEICEPLHGVTAALDDYFISPRSGLEYDMPPAHIQCRCTVVMIG